MTKKATRLSPDERIALMRASGLEPLEPYKSAVSPWLCRCLECGQNVSPMYNTIQQGHTGCKSCASKKRGLRGRKSDLEIENTLERFSLKLVSQYVRADVPVEVLCLLCGEKSLIKLDALRTRTQPGCTSCARRASSQRQVSAEDALSYMRAKGLEPLEPYKGYKSPWLVRCNICSETVSITRESIRRRSPQFLGCISCAKIAQNKFSVDSNTDEVLERFKKLDLQLLSEYLGTKRQVQVKCNRCGFQFETTGSQIKQQKFGCGRCSGNLVDPAAAVAFMLDHGFEPLEDYVSVRHPWKCRHVKCGRTVAVPLATTKRTGGGCKHCAQYGFQHSKPAYLYLIRNVNLNSIKIGIANPARRSDGDRLKRFIQQSWEIIGRWNFNEGSLAEEVEKRIFQIIRKERGIPVHLSSAEMPLGGHTETLSQDSIEILELKDLINLIVAEVKKNSPK